MYSVVRACAYLCAVVLMSIALPSFVFADNAGTTSATADGSASESAATAVNNIVILQAGDPEPITAVRLQTVRIGDEVPGENASLSSLIASAKKLALKSDANIIKINEQKARNKANICDHIVATLYKVDNPHAYETGFSWTPGRRLIWDDFKGPVQPYTGDNVAAATFCSIGFETNTVTLVNKKLKVNVFNTFYTTRSWGREGEKDERLLAHEQGHFDLCEIYTRKLRERMANVDVDVYTLSTKLKAIYRTLQSEYEQRQELYEEQTNHGLVTAEQQRWQKMISQELQKSENWKES